VLVCPQEGVAQHSVTATRSSGLFRATTRCHSVFEAHSSSASFHDRCACRQARGDRKNGEHSAVAARLAPLWGFADESDDLSGIEICFLKSPCVPL